MWRFLKILEIELPYDPAIPLLGIHTEETRRDRPIDQSDIARRMAEFRAGQAQTTAREEEARRRMKAETGATRPAANMPAAEAARQKAMEQKPQQQEAL